MNEQKSIELTATEYQECFAQTAVVKEDYPELIPAYYQLDLQAMSVLELLDLEKYVFSEVDLRTRNFLKSLSAVKPARFEFAESVRDAHGGEWRIASIFEDPECTQILTVLFQESHRAPWVEITFDCLSVWIRFYVLKALEKLSGSGEAKANGGADPEK